MLYPDSDLVIFEMANNHMGSETLGLKIIQEFAALAKIHHQNAAIKFQFRNLPTFIHPDFINDFSRPYVKRFKETELSLDAYSRLVKAAKIEGLKTICTPFDEVSVDHIEKLNFDALKIASCSAKDISLLSRVQKSSLPVIASTATLSMTEISAMVDRLLPRNFLALLHCVALYPTPQEHANLGRISKLAEHFSHLPIGFSSHEPPNNTCNVQIAYALGARIFEKHVGIETINYPLNNYSTTPQQMNDWLEALQNAKKLCHYAPHSQAIEKQKLNELKRGIFLKDSRAKGSQVNLEDTFLAFPKANENQFSADEIERFALVAKVDLQKNQPLLKI